MNADSGWGYRADTGWGATGDPGWGCGPRPARRSDIGWG